MSVEAAGSLCYLVEWYRSDLTGQPLGDVVARLEEGAAAMCDDGASVRLLMTLAVPTDEVLFGVFAADSAQAVSKACRRAGFPAERLTGAVDARIAGKT